MIVRKLGGRGVVLPSRRDQRIKFVVRHTIADIEYSCDGFLEKNQDILKKELLDVLKASPNAVMAGMFEDVVVEAGKIGKGSLIASQFLRSLSSMIGLIRVFLVFLFMQHKTANSFRSKLPAQQLAQTNLLDSNKHSPVLSRIKAEKPSLKAS